MIAFYPVVALLGPARRPRLGRAPGRLRTSTRLVRVLGIYAKPKPATAPDGYLILAALVRRDRLFITNRLAGGLFVLGLMINIALAR
jgi:hypothetical protein